MSKDPLLDFGNIRIEKLVISPDRSEDVTPYGFGLPIYGTAPGSGTNNPGTVIFNSTTNTIDVTRNDKSYISLAFAGDAPSGDIILQSYASDADAPAVNGSIYLNTEDYINTLRYRSADVYYSIASTDLTHLSDFAAPIANIDMDGYTLFNVADPADDTQAVNKGFMMANTLASDATLDAIATANPTAGTINLNNNQVSNLATALVGGQAVEYNQFLAAPFLSDTTTLNDLSVTNPTSGEVDLNNNRIINLTAASGSGEAVEYDQFLAAPFLSDTSTLDAIAVANATAADVPMNSHKLTGLTAGTVAGDSVEYNQLVTAAFWVNTARLNDIATANPTSANISMNSHKLTGLTAGSGSGEAVEYGQLSGFYANTVPLQSITLATADVNINTHKLLNVVDPSSAQDGATKNYVDINVGTRASYSMWLTTPASTTITVAGTMYKLAGTFAYGTGANFGNGATDNRFVYTGATTAMMQMNVSATLSHDAAATTTNIRVAIMKNGVTLLGSSSSALQSGGTVLVNIPVNISTVGQTSMATNDYLEIFVTTDAVVGTTNVTPVAVLATISAVS